jgi:hypothetical protein
MAAATPEQYEAATAEALSTPEGRRALAEDICYFDTTSCGMRFARHRERWLDTFVSARERAATPVEYKTAGGKKRKRRRKLRVLILAPRKHGKTEALITFATREICKNRNVRILWICANADRSKERVGRVKALLESDGIKADWCNNPDSGYGPFPTETWGKQQLIVQRTINAVDPTLIAVGYGGSITGGHFDIIILDDIEDDKTVLNAPQRRKLRNWFFGTVGPMLNPGGVMLGAGTRKHHDDLYAHLTRKKSWTVIQDVAIVRWPEAPSGEVVDGEDLHDVLTSTGEAPKAYEYIMGRDPVTGDEVLEDVVVYGDSEVLWPEERPIEYLLSELYEFGSRLFYREFQNQVQDDANAPVKWKHLEVAQNRGARLSLYQVPPDVKLTYVNQAWDFAVVDDPEHAELTDSDYTVGVTWGRDTDGNRYLLGLFRERGLTPAQIWAAMVREYERFQGIGFNVRHVGVERNNTGAIHEWRIGASTDLPLVSHTTTGAKKADPWNGIPTLGMLLERGKMVFPYATPEDQEVVDVLCRELWGLGTEVHDDTVLALWIAELVLRKRGRFVHRGAFDSEVDLNRVEEVPEEEDDYDPAAAELWGSLGIQLGM